MNIFRSIAFMGLLTAAATLIGCSSTSDPASGGKVKMASELENAEVSAVEITKGDRVEGQPFVVTIESSRILISRMKFQTSGDDQDSGGSDVKAGPAVLVFEDDLNATIFDVVLPAGTYTRTKFEKHKFSSSEAADYADDPIFGEFAAPERLTLIIEGFVDEAGVETPFTLTDDQTENLWVDFDNPLVVEDGSSSSLELVFDASDMFKSGNVVLNPLDAKDEKEILRNLKHAFKVQNSD